MAEGTVLRGQHVVARLTQLLIKNESVIVAPGLAPRKATAPPTAKTRFSFSCYAAAIGMDISLQAVIMKRQHLSGASVDATATRVPH